MDASPETERISPISWLAVFLGYLTAGVVIVLGVAGSDLPVTTELPHIGAFVILIAVPATLALAGLLGRPVLLLPASVCALTSMPFLSVLGIPMAVLGIVWLWSYSTLRPSGDGVHKTLITLVVWLLWTSAGVVLLLHVDPRCIQTLTDGTVVHVDAARRGFETGWLWAVSSTTEGGSVMSADVVSEVCSGDVVTEWERLLSVLLASGALAVGWFTTRASAPPPAK